MVVTGIRVIIMIVVIVVVVYVMILVSGMVPVPMVSSVISGQSWESCAQMAAFSGMSCRAKFPQPGGVESSQARGVLLDSRPTRVT